MGGGGVDNRSINVVSEGDSGLKMALSIIWEGVPGKKATHYKIVKLIEKVDYYGEPTTHHSRNFAEGDVGKPTLILLWNDERNAIPLPYPLELDEAITFALGWLRKAERGHEPDHDGDNGDGWRVFTDFWGHVAGHHYGIIGIQPAWAMYGK